MIIGSVALFVNTVSADPGDNEIYATPDNNGHIEVGNTFNITFNMTINTAINSIGLDNLTFDNKVSGTGTPTQGDVLTNGQVVFWNYTDWSTNAQYYVAPLAYWANNETTNTTTGEICNTTWHALLCGISYINITEGGTSNGATDVSTNFHNTTVTIYPADPVSPSATAYGASQINLTWTKGQGAYQTAIVAKQNSLPASYSDGAVVYNNTDTHYEHSGLSGSEHWYYRFYSWNSTASLLSLENTTADAQTESGAVVISSFLSSHNQRHCVDWVNHSVNVVNATSVFLNITCADSTDLSINITQNHSGNYYWCNRTFDNGASPGGPPYGWPEYGNGSYVAKIYAVGESDSGESSTLNFYIYPNADVTMNNQTSAADLSQIVGGNWMGSGANRFCVEDTNGNGQVSAADLSYVVNAANWMWAGGT